MKYVTLEHRQSLPYGTIGCRYVNFDTNDTAFETEAYELRHQRYLKQEEAKNKIIDEISHVTDQANQTKQEQEELRNNTPVLKRLFSKEYKSERKRLQKQEQKHRIRHLKLMKEAERLADDVFEPFDKYHYLKTLLKESGYVLVNKTTNDKYTTTEIWHKD